MSVQATPSEWRLAAKEENVEHTSIYSLNNLHSASKIGEAQYLALRTIWTRKRSFVAGNWGIKGVSRAREILAGLDGWTLYLKSLSDKYDLTDVVPNLGPFSLVWYYQKLVTTTEIRGEGESKLEVFSRRQTRAQARQESSNSPSRGALVYDNSSSDEGDATMMEHNLVSPTAHGAGRILFTDVDDEQIVNSCLLNFLHAISFHVKGHGGHWTLSRKAFKFGKDNDVLYQARTDGYLWMPDGDKRTLRAIAEVKPYVRTDEVKYQETAQMAAWIFSEPDEPSGSGTYRRLMISQDRHEIFLTFAEYDNGYIKYINNECSSSDELSLMRMTEFGPWQVQDPKEMKAIGEIVLAFMLQNGKLEPKGSPDDGDNAKGKGPAQPPPPPSGPSKGKQKAKEAQLPIRRSNRINNK